MKKRSELKSVREMTLSELREEVRLTRRTITRWAKAYNKAGNERCHELDQALAAMVGISLYPDRKKGKMLASVFASNCEHYINRECRRGALVGDRQK